MTGSISITRHPEEGGLPVREQKTEPIFLQIAYEMDIPIVATNDVHFLNSEHLNLMTHYSV